MTKLPLKGDILFPNELDNLDKLRCKPCMPKQPKLDAYLPLAVPWHVTSCNAVFVKKFPLLGEEYLFAYKVNEREKEVIFLAIGGHENFYRDLKGYLKSG